MWKTLVVLAVSAICIVCVSACAAPSPAAVPAPTQAPVITAEPAKAPAVEPTTAPESTRPPELPATPGPTQPPASASSPIYPHPVRSEVILLGSKQGIENVLTAVPIVQPGLKLTVVPDKSEYNAHTGLPVVYICDGCGIQLFDLSSKSPKDVGLVVAIAQWVRSTKGDKVYATPNYPLILSDLGIPTAADPYYIGGSPYYIGGSPYYIGGSPVWSPSELQAAMSDFDAQWAFVNKPPKGIDLAMGVQSPESTKNVRAYVLDTNPLSPGTPYPLDPSTVDGVLTVTAPFSQAQGQASTVTPCVQVPHGLFVAELLHAVAPAVPITLMPVLDECGQGLLFGLQAALDTAWKEHEKSKDHIVLNLSLGVELDSRTADALNVSEPGLKASCAQLYSDADAQKMCEEDTKEDVKAIRTLEMQLSKMHEKGAVTVAAAGNGSAGLVDAADMQRPAAYPWVIGVSASDQSGGRACYSNERKDSEMWVRAPGGNGYSGQSASSGQTVNCVPYSDQCDAQGGKDCPYGIISLLQPGPDYRYGYWAGTSFAAPLVSGLAALCLQEHATSTKPELLWAGKQVSQVADGVWTAISTGAGGPGKVINVPTTVAECRK